MTAEWLEADGLGGFASGTASGIRTRRYHALLLRRRRRRPAASCWSTASTLGWTWQAGLRDHDAAIRAGRAASRWRRRGSSFTHEPWPTWEFGRRRRPDSRKSSSTAGGPVAIAWTLDRGSAAAGLRVRPFLSGRDYHALHHENGALPFRRGGGGARSGSGPYAGLPSIVSLTNGDYATRPIGIGLPLFRGTGRGLERSRIWLRRVSSLDAVGTERRAIWMLKAGHREPPNHVARRMSSASYGAVAAERARAARLCIAARSRRRRVPRPARSRPDDHRRLPVVYRLGPRHVHRDPRPVPCNRPARDARDILVQWAGAVSERHHGFATSTMAGAHIRRARFFSFQHRLVRRLSKRRSLRLPAKPH